MADNFEDISAAYGEHEWGSEAADQVRAERSDDYVVVYNDEDGTSPSIKHGMKLMAGVFFGIVFLAFVLVFTMMHCNRKQEERKRERAEAEKEEEVHKVRKSLVGKEWKDGPNPRMSDGTQRTLSIRMDGSFDDFSSSWGDYSDPETGSTDSPPSAAMVAMDGIPEDGSVTSGSTPNFHKCKDGEVCVLCNDPFMDGEEFVESNNPKCGHIFHKNCIEKWLTIQNTCPICNQPYMLQLQRQPKTKSTRRSIRF